MSNSITSRLIIEADDKTAGAFSAIAKHIDQIERAAKSLNKSMAAVNVAGPVSRASERVASAAGAVSRAGRPMNPATMSAMNAGLTAGHVVKGMAVAAAAKVAHNTLETYGDFDDTVRYQKAILGLKEAESRAFIEQATHMGSTTRFNDLQVLHAQTDLAQRGVNKDFIRPFVDQAANYAGAMGTDLPDAVKTLEGIIFSTGKHIESAGDAFETMHKAVNFSVKLAKIGGLDNEDVKQFFKYAGQSGSVAGLSDETMGAAAALMRRSNIRGDEAGVAMRAIAGHLVSPTRKGQEALNAMGLNFNDYTKQKDALSVDNLGLATQRKFGPSGALSAAQKEKLKGILSDPDVLANQEEFIKQSASVVTEGFAKNKKGKVNAETAKSVAKAMGDFYKMAIASVDTNRLLRDIIAANPTLAQANALIGEKQGGRLLAVASHGIDAFEALVSKLKNAGNIADEINSSRNAGFKGAYSRFEGTLKNMETALGHFFDKPLTGMFDGLAKATQSAAEALWKLSENTNPLSRYFDRLEAKETAEINAEANRTGRSADDVRKDREAQRLGFSSYKAQQEAQQKVDDFLGGVWDLWSGKGSTTDSIKAEARAEAIKDAKFRVDTFEQANSEIQAKLARWATSKDPARQQGPDMLRARAASLAYDLANEKARLNSLELDDARARISGQRITQQGKRTVAGTGNFDLSGPKAGKPAYELPDKVEATLTGTADVKGEVTVTVRVEAGSSLVEAKAAAERAVANLKGQLNANGPGSRGTSSPDAGSAEP